MSQLNQWFQQQGTILSRILVDNTADILLKQNSKVTKDFVTHCIAVYKQFTFSI